MKIISAGIPRTAVIILALTSFLVLTAFQAFAQENSQAPVQKGDDYTFSHDMNEETIRFEAVNPRTQVAGRMTVSVTGAVRGKRLWDGQSAVGSHLQGQRRRPSVSSLIIRIRPAILRRSGCCKLPGTPPTIPFSWTSDSGPTGQTDRCSGSCSGKKLQLPRLARRSPFSS